MRQDFENMYYQFIRLRQQHISYCKNLNLFDKLKYSFKQKIMNLTAFEIFTSQIRSKFYLFPFYLLTEA